MYKKISLLGIYLALGIIYSQSAKASTINLIPSITTVNLGSTINVAISANIDASDAIIGYGFDLSLSPGGVFNFIGFTPGSLFDDDPNLALLSDNDGIRGASNGDLFNGTEVFGNDILLGTLTLKAIGIGNGTVGLFADDLNFFFTEGLIPGDINKVNFLPTVSDTTIAVVATPIPSSGILFGVAVTMLLSSTLKLGEKENSLLS